MGKPRRIVLAALSVLAAGVALAACAAMTPTPTPKPVVHNATYELHATYFSHASGLKVVIDPQVFQSAPGNPPEIGPEAITHAQGIRPVAASAAAGTPLLSARGVQLGITLGQWQAASGTVTFTCTNGNETATSTLTGLVPRGQYSLFVEHLKVTGDGRYTPWGDSAGTTNNFAADADGMASPTSTVSGCLGATSAALIVWHSDGKDHGATPGSFGVNVHNNLIVPIP